MLNKHFGETNLHLAIILVSFYIKMKISDYYILTFAALSFIILAGAWLTDNQFRNDIFLLLFVPEKFFLKLSFDFHHVSVESFGVPVLSSWQHSFLQEETQLNLTNILFKCI